MILRFYIFFKCHFDCYLKNGCGQPEWEQRETSHRLLR